MLRIILTTLALLISTSSFADKLEDELYKASLLYDQGKYSESTQIYEGLVEKKHRLPGLYFNLGNSYYKMSRRGEAVASYLKAYMMDPSDPDIKANLGFAMKDNKDQLPLPKFSSIQEKIFFPIIESTTLERYWCTVISLTIFLLCIISSLLFSKSTKLWYILALFFFTASLYFGTATFSLDRSEIEVAALKQDSDVYSEPNRIGSVVLFSLHTGSPMKVLKKSNSFCKVELFDGKKGWIEESKLKTL